MKLPFDQRSDGEVTSNLLDALLSAAPPETPPSRLRIALRRAATWIRSIVEGPARVDIPDRLREDAGLAPKDEPRRPEPWDRLW